MGEGLNKPRAAGKLLEIMSSERWKIVCDAVQNARKLNLAERSKAKKFDEFSMIILLRNVAF